MNDVTLTNDQVALGFVILNDKLTIKAASLDRINERGEKLKHLLRVLFQGNERPRFKHPGEINNFYISPIGLEFLVKVKTISPESIRPWDDAKSMLTRFLNWKDSYDKNIRSIIQTLERTKFELIDIHQVALEAVLTRKEYYFLEYGHEKLEWEGKNGAIWSGMQLISFAVLLRKLNKTHNFVVETRDDTPTSGFGMDAQKDFIIAVKSAVTLIYLLTDQAKIYFDEAENLIKELIEHLPNVPLPSRV